MRMKSFYEVLYSPKKTIQNNVNSTNLLTPTFIIGAFSAIFTILSTLFMADTLIREKDIEYIKPIIIFFSIIVGGISPLISILISSIINYIALIVADVFVEFRKLMIIGFYAYIPVLIDFLLKIVISLALGQNFRYSPTSLAEFIPEENILIQNLLNSFSVTGIWSLVIYFIGLLLLINENNDLKNKKKAVIVVLIVNILLTIMMAVFSSLTGDTSNMTEFIE